MPPQNAGRRYAFTTDTELEIRRARAVLRQADASRAAASRMAAFVADAPGLTIPASDPFKHLGIISNLLTEKENAHVWQFKVGDGAWIGCRV